MTKAQKMKILAIDTSSKFLNIALGEDNFIISEESHLLDRQHSALLVPKVKELLEKCNSNIGDIDAFVVGLGPGSFTGLRIGVSSIKGFGIATRKPCIGVASIDALAMNADGEEIAIVPVIDAKRSQVYSAIYKKKNNDISKVSAYLLLTIDDLMKKIKGPAIFLGDGINLYKEKIHRVCRNAIFLDEKYWYPKASSLIKLSLKNIKRRRKQDLGKLKPLYIYSKYCQVKSSSKP